MRPAIAPVACRRALSSDSEKRSSGIFGDLLREEQVS
jgi:hypothetical protein